MKHTSLVLCLLLGMVLTSLGQSTDAPAAPPLLEQHRLTAMLRRAQQLYDDEQYQESLACLNSITGSAAQDPGVRNMQGTILTKLGNYDQARQIFQGILETTPTFAPAVYNLGEVQFVQGNYEGALASFVEMNRQDPRNELVRFKLVLIHLLLGHQADAEQLAASLIPTGSTPAWYYTQAALAKKRGETGEEKKNITVAQEIYGKKACKDFDAAIHAVKF